MPYELDSHSIGTLFAIANAHYGPNHLGYYLHGTRGAVNRQQESFSGEKRSRAAYKGAVRAQILRFPLNCPRRGGCGNGPSDFSSGIYAFFFGVHHYSPPSVSSRLCNVQSQSCREGLHYKENMWGCFNPLPVG